MTTPNQPVGKVIYHLPDSLTGRCWRCGKKRGVKYGGICSFQPMNRPDRGKKEIPSSKLLMFIRITVFGLKFNKNYPGLGDELEKLFKEYFKQELV